MSFFKSIYNAIVGAPASPQDLARAKQTAEALIQSPIAVFSKGYCPHCTRSKQLLHDLGQDSSTKVLELDQVQDGSAIQAYLAERAGVSRVTVPQIFIKGKLIGGNSDLQALHQSGQLKALLP